MNKFLEKFKRKDLIRDLDEFYELYQSRPIKDNNGGMKSAHMFSAWFVVKNLRPKTLIESGVWKGLGTWFFEQASPQTQIISIDPRPDFRIYTGKNVIYKTEDFLSVNWDVLEKDDSLVFFDDHQNSIERIAKCKTLGFKRLMFEDNYPWQQGDCYTPKKILANRDYVIDKDGSRVFYSKNVQDLKFFVENVSVYQEMPPIFKGHTTRWGSEWNEEYPTNEPLLSFQDKEKYPIFYNELLDYTWICYLEL